MRAWLCAFALVASASDAVAQQDALIAQGWSVGSVEEIAAADTDVWSYVAERDALRSNVSGMICPQDLSDVRLAGAKGSALVAECWYPSGAREGLWAVSFDGAEDARRRQGQNYASLPSNPDFELALLETSVIGVCSLEIRRMRNVHGYWITLRDLYTPTALHQFRTITHEGAHRGRMDALAQQLLDISLATRCAGSS
ncbi:MAG: hypothetical protein NT015_12110 [Alphaproteobacteria bacterium]|nr:hypothetical protein [Alphaproteobacteria bacterium]